MIRRVIVPDGWACTVKECRPGPFVTLENPELLCFMSEYHHDDGRCMAYNSAGEFFCGEALVQPVNMIEESDD